MRVLLLRGIFLEGKLAEVVSLDSLADDRFVEKVEQWREFLPFSPADITGYLGARLSPLVFLFVGERQQVHDLRVMAQFALESMGEQRHRDYSFLSLDLSVMRDDVPDEAYTALGCFHRDLLSSSERQEKEMEPAFIEEQLGDEQAALGLLMVPRAVGHYPGESLIRGNEAEEDKQTARRVIARWLQEDVRTVVDQNHRNV